MSTRGSLHPVVAILSPDFGEARELAARIVEDGLVPVVAPDADALVSLLDGPRPPDVLLVDPLVPGCATAMARAGVSGGPALIVLGDKPAGQLGVQRPARASTLSRRLAWALHARHGGANSGDELRTMSSLASFLNAGNPGRVALGDALSRFSEGIGADCGRLALAAPIPGTGLSEIASWGAVAPASDRKPMPVLTWVQAQQRPVRLAGSLEAFPQFAGVGLDPPGA